MTQQLVRVRPARPGLWARLRRPAPAESVQVVLTGHPHAVTAVARALAGAVVVTGMSHHVRSHADPAPGPAVIRIDAVCYPALRIGGAR